MLDIVASLAIYRNAPLVQIHWVAMVTKRDGIAQGGEFVIIRMEFVFALRGLWVIDVRSRTPLRNK